MIKHLFRPPSALMIAQKELENAKRTLLQYHATAEHAAKMVEFYEGSIKRLTAYVQKENQDFQQV